MADRIVSIGYFLEDVAQDEFIRGLVSRIALEEGIHLHLNHIVRNATGGSGTTLAQLDRFLRDARVGDQPRFDILVIAIDGNCHGYHERRREVEDHLERQQYEGSAVIAIPDPHVERWYMLDPQALGQATETGVTIQAPRYKCERGYYKNALRATLREANLAAPLGGYEYGQDVASLMDLYSAGRSDSAFHHFIQSLRVRLRELKRVLDI
jgi:hypothetical protein